MEYLVMLSKQFVGDNDLKVEIEAEGFCTSDSGDLRIKTGDTVVAIFAPGSWKYVKVK